MAEAERSRLSRKSIYGEKAAGAGPGDPTTFYNGWSCVTDVSITHEPSRGWVDCCSSCCAASAQLGSRQEACWLKGGCTLKPYPPSSFLAPAHDVLHLRPSSHRMDA